MGMNKTTWLTNRLLRLSYYADHSQLSQALSFIMLWVEGISLPYMLDMAARPVVMYQLTA